VKPKVSENEQYLSGSNRITAVVVMVIGLAGLIDIVLEWRTAGGLLVAALIGILIVVTYIGLFRPSVTLRPDGMLVRNHVRDHLVPWNRITDVGVADILRIETEEGRIRCPGVQLVMRDLRKQRVGGRKLANENSISRADFVVERIENHRERYAASADPDSKVVTTWAIPELAVLGGLAAVAVIAQLLR
jgi:Bacterial PH domain